MRSESGQAATENMLVIAVLAIAVVGAAYTFVPTFKDGVRDLAVDVQTILASGDIGGDGVERNGSAGNPIENHHGSPSDRTGNPGSGGHTTERPTDDGGDSGTTTNGTNSNGSAGDHTAHGRNPYSTPPVANGAAQRLGGPQGDSA